MTSVRMIVDVSGTRDGVRWPGRGETAVVSDAEAADLIAAGLAEPVEPAAKKAKGRVETATMPAAETAQG